MFHYLYKIFNSLFKSDWLSCPSNCQTLSDHQSLGCGGAPIGLGIGRIGSGVIIGRLWSLIENWVILGCLESETIFLLRTFVMGGCGVGAAQAGCGQALFLTNSTS